MVAPVEVLPGECCSVSVGDNAPHECDDEITLECDDAPEGEVCPFDEAPEDRCAWWL